jgi:nitrogen-specific signal transduction histidine kinase
MPLDAAAAAWFNAWRRYAFTPMTRKTQTQAQDPSTLARAIERAKQELQHMMDVAPQVMLLVDRAGTVLRANRALLKFGCFQGFAEVLGKRLGDAFGCEDPDWFDRLARGQEAGGAQTVRVRCGAQRDILFTVIASAGDSGQYVVVANDVTGADEELAQIEKRHKCEAAAALVGGLMHTINQPLTVISVTAKLMHMALERGNADPEEMKKQLETIMDLTLQVSGTLERVRVPGDFVTEAYPGNVQIMDLQASTRTAGEAKAQDRT